MIHARSDYDAIQPWPTKRLHIAKTIDGRTETMPSTWGKRDPEGMQPVIPDDEPVFLIRGQDLAAIPAAEAWCEAASELGADPELIATVRRHIELVREWQQDHAKVPDAPAGVLR